MTVTGERNEAKRIRMEGTFQVPKHNAPGHRSHVLTVWTYIV